MSTIPTNPPANPVPGAVYVDIATNTAYVWTGTGWIPSGGSTGYNTQITTGAAILPGYFAQPDPSSYIAQVGSEPLNPSEGQIWVDDTDPTTPNPAYVWHDGAWVKLTDGTFTDTTVAAVPPASPDLGDTYYETATGRFYVWDGTAWKIIGEGDDTHSIYTMSTPTTRANGVALQPGDMWVNSVNGNLSYWTGSSWILMSAGGGSVATSIITYATAPAVGAEGDVYFNSTDNVLYVSDGATWVPITSTVNPAQPAVEGIVYGTTNTLGLTTLGYEAGGAEVTSPSNVLIGGLTGRYVDGEHNTYVGYAIGGAGTNLGNGTSGTGNTYIGSKIAFAGQAAESYLNTIVGYDNILYSQGTLNTVIGTHVGSSGYAIGSGNLVIGSVPSGLSQENRAIISYGSTNLGVDSQSTIGLIRGNENGSWGLWGASGLEESDFNFGSPGQFLTSGGAGAPPEWSTPSGLLITASSNSSSANPTSFYGTKKFVIVRPGETNIVLSDAAFYNSTHSGSFIKFTTQHTNPITVTTTSGTDLFNGIGTSYVWTPNAAGETLTVYYMYDFHADPLYFGYGWIVEKSA